jgi:ubiquitin-activating enzyme E1
MTEVNGSAPRPITVKSPYAFTIEDTSSYNPYVRGGWAHQVKMPKDISFKPFASMLGNVGGVDGL